ncbi:MAG: hypothetical protein L6437_01645 [Kiritimatiellae bacterium]|nr:hypothetical protein [Kiritimatiellia bacterium]
MKASFIFSSNAVRLSWKEWVAVCAIILLAIALLPEILQRKDLFRHKQDFRIPYQLSDDYWISGQWIAFASENYPVIVLGDSVIWGQYVNKDETLTHYLNKLSGRQVAANLGVDGMHPAAMHGLIRYYGRPLEGKTVILHLNLLWMSSPEADLTTKAKEEIRFNHPRLVPQISGKPTCYRPAFNQIIGAIGERSFPFFRLVHHIRLVYYENMDIKNWSLLHPAELPVPCTGIKLKSILTEDRKTDIQTDKRAARREDLSWVRLENSYQWAHFKKIIDILNSRNNAVFVLIGPFNPDVLTEEGLKGYMQIRQDVETWLDKQGLPYHIVSEMPPEYYADATHPLGQGYETIAEQLMGNSAFRDWLVSAGQKNGLK